VERLWRARYSVKQAAFRSTEYLQEVRVNQLHAPTANRVEAVERALSLLQCFRLPGEELSLAILAQRSALSKSTILRLAGSLIRKGFLHRDRHGRYLLGPELQRLGGLARTTIRLAELIRPVLLSLSETTRETASFYVRDGDERVCLFRQNSVRSARHHLDEGTRHPLDQGAAGMVLRAYEAGAGDGGDVRRQGWAVSLGNRDPEIAAVAVPVTNAEGTLWGALTISGLIQRFGPEAVETYRGLLLDEAARLQVRLPLIRHDDGTLTQS
jgi:DNA-binding IclR family transcriptional regulator